MRCSELRLVINEMNFRKFSSFTNGYEIPLIVRSFPSDLVVSPAVDIVGVATSPPNMSQICGQVSHCSEWSEKSSNSRLTNPRSLIARPSNVSGFFWTSQIATSGGTACGDAELGRSGAMVIKAIANAAFVLAHLSRQYNRRLKNLYSKTLALRSSLQ